MPGSRRARGVALLIVLVSLATLATLCAGVARLAATARAERRLDRLSLLAGDLLNQAQWPILAWLEKQADRVVLDPGVGSPRVRVLHDAWQAGRVPVALQITAWDQWAMVPIELALAGSPLRLVLPSDVREILGRLEVAPRGPWGLDRLAGAAPERRLFPRAVSGPATVFGAGPPPPATAAGASPARLAIGELLATHTSSLPHININTAPRPLLERCLLLAGRGGLESIRQHRRRGEVAPVPPPNREAQGGAPLPAARSDVWAFRIDGQAGAVRRSLWCIYARIKASWRREQSLVITE